jgi:hypothetical protein
LVAIVGVVFVVFLFLTKTTALAVAVFLILAAWLSWEIYLAGPRVYASGMTGVLSDRGKPLPGVTLVRNVSSWEHKTKQKAETNENGEFSFEAVTGRRSLLEYLPLPGTITVNIWLDIEGAPPKDSVWGLTKWNYERNGELGVPLRLECDLADEVTDEQAAERGYFGKCRVLDTPPFRLS